mgnify:CR=1 FL=1
MFLNGRDVKFKFTVGASFEIADMCPEGKLDNIGALFEGSYREAAENEHKFVLALNKGYIESMKYSNPKFDEEPLKEEEIMLLDQNEYEQLSQEAFAAYLGDSKRKITTAPVSTKKKGQSAVKK